MDNIVINFATNTEPIDAATQSMENLEAADKGVADQAKITMEAYAKRDKTIKDGSASTKKSFDELAQSVTKLSKGIIGGTFEDTFKKIRTEVQLTDKQFKTFLQNVQRQAKIDIASAKNQQEVKNLKDTITAAGVALQQMAIAESNVEAKSQSMKSRLRELKVELQQLEDQGKENTAEFERLQIEAGRVEDQINDTNQRIKALGSDTFAFDAIISGVTGIAGAFSIAQGAAALFGSEDEDLQKALLKVNAAMAILQGLTQIQNVLQKQSTVSIALSALLRKKDAEATVAQTVAMEGETVALVEGTAAQEGLNVAMAANPAGLILGAIVAITAAILIFGNGSEDAAEKSKKLNEQLDKQYDLSKKLAEFDPAIRNQRLLVKALEETNAARKAAGQSESDQALADLKLQQERIKLSNLVRDNVVQTNKEVGLSYAGAKEELEGLLKTQKTIESDSKNALNEIGTLTDQIINSDIDAQAAAARIDELQKKVVSKGQVEARQQRIDFLSKVVKDNEDAESAVAEDTAKGQETVNGIIAAGQAEALKSATAYAEARLLIAKSGSREALNAEIAAIRARQHEESADPNLTPGERYKIVEQANHDIQKANEDFNQADIKNAKEAVDAKVLASKEGTKEELDFKLKSLELQYLADISDKDKSIGALLKIDEQYTKDREKLITDSNRKIAEDVINTHIAEAKTSIANLQAAGVDSTNEDLLQAKKDLIHEQAALEVISIQASEKNEELRAAKIKAVYAQELSDKKELEKAKAKAEIDNSLANRTSGTDFKISAAQRELDNDKLTNSQRLKAQQDLFDAQKEHINDLQDANADSYFAGIKNLDEFNRTKTELLSEQADLEAQMLKTEEERKLAIRKQYEDLFVKSVNTAFSFVLDHYDQEEARIRQLYQNKQISEAKYNVESRKIQEQRAKTEKELAVFNVLVNEGPAVIKGFQQSGAAGAAAALALVLSLLAATKSVQEPKFRYGGIIDGPGTGTSDSVHIRASKGEFITKHEMTSKHRDALEAINNNQFDKYLQDKILPELYSNLQMNDQDKDTSDALTRHVHIANGGIDYDLLTDMLASKIGAKIGSSDRVVEAIENMPLPFIQFDENGGFIGIKKHEEQTIYINKKLNQ